MIMKKILLLTLLLGTALALHLRAGIVILVGSGVNIAPMSSSNFTTTATVGSFTFSPQYLYLGQAGLSNSSQVFVNGYLSLDGTNKFTLPQAFQWTNNAANSSTLWAVTNATFPVYGMMSISNGTPAVITNFNAALQY